MVSASPIGSFRPPYACLIQNPTFPVFSGTGTTSDTAQIKQNVYSKPQRLPETLRYKSHIITFTKNVHLANLEPNIPQNSSKFCPNDRNFLLQHTLRLHDVTFSYSAG